MPWELKAVRDASPAGVILVADDDPDFTEGVKLTLTEAGYTVTIARTGQEAVDKALDSDIDVLLLDMRMPVLSGLEVYRELEKHGRALPTIIVTGYDVEESVNIRDLLQMSAKRCLVKPIGTTELLQAIEEIV